MATAGTDIDLLTVAEAAQLLKVSTLTVHRWIKQGRLRACKLGPRNIRIRRSDIRRMLAPASKLGTTSAAESSPEEVAYALRPLTEDEINAGLAATRGARVLRERMLAERHGKLFSPSWPMIRKAREDRSEHL